MSRFRKGFWHINIYGVRPREVYGLKLASMKILSLNFGMVLAGLLVLACNRSDNIPTPQLIVDRAIEVSGGSNYEACGITFRFRDYRYRRDVTPAGTVLSRILAGDSSTVIDRLEAGILQRSINGSPVILPDTTAQAYGNSVNSVWYFALLPYKLNDAAVRKQFLGRQRINQRDYYKLGITFDQQGGGTDYEDEFVFWMDSETGTMDYLAYEFHVNGGGMRFREAYNARYVNGLRFVDYRNFEPAIAPDSVSTLDRLYLEGKLKPLSQIVLTDITVVLDSCN